jgi:peptide/nickel transport system ATP-binding protein
VTIQAQILHEAQELCRRNGTAMIWITHDLAVVSSLADRVAVMYAGHDRRAGSCERGDPRAAAPLHQGPAGLRAVRQPSGDALAQIPGMMPSSLDPAPGCRFLGRCSRAAAECSTMPALSTPISGREVRCWRPLTGRAAVMTAAASVPIVEARDLSKRFVKDADLA